jgi:hypothetical protein
MRMSRKFQFALAALSVSMAGFTAMPVANASTVSTCQSVSFTNGGYDGTGANCPADTIFTNTPDPTSNAAPQLQDGKLNGSPLLGSFSGAGTFPSLDGGTFAITENAADTSGTWSFSGTTGDLFPAEVLISGGSNWFFTLTGGATSGTWSTCPSGLGGSLCLENPPGNAVQTLSHIAFFDGAETPVPAALPLFATGLGAMGLLGWRRKRKNTAAVAA